MKHYPPPHARPRTPALRIPPFHAVPVRIRADGWTPLRQAEFIGQLAATRNVSAAARWVSMARETAYRLRNKPGAEGFRAAWDVALLGAFERLGTDVRRERWLSAYEAALVALRPHKVVTLAQLRWRVETGVWHAVLRGGRYCGVRRKPDDSALLALLSRTRGCEAGGAS